MSTTYMTVSGTAVHVRSFPGQARQVGAARQFVGQSLAGCPARDRLVTCVSELAANAIEHTESGAGGEFTVAVGWPRDGVAFVAVRDAGGPGKPTGNRSGPGLSVGAGREDGRGRPGGWPGEHSRGNPGGRPVPAGRTVGAGWPGEHGRGDTPGKADGLAESGRGLALVAAYSSRWGYRDTARGRTVWAEATWPVPVRGGGGVRRAAPDVWEDTWANLVAPLGVA